MEDPELGATGIWEIRNFTEDAHPIHIRQVQFQVVNREVTDPALSPHSSPYGSAVIPREKWETATRTRSSCTRESSPG